VFSIPGVEIGGPFDKRSGGGPGAWWILDEPELHLGEHVLVPDLAGWRRECMPNLSDSGCFGRRDGSYEPAVAQILLRRDRPVYLGHLEGLVIAFQQQFHPEP
jgi:hypothetical protein